MSIEDFEYRSCPLCNCTESILLYCMKEVLRYKNVNKNIDFNIVKCPDCDLIFVNPRLNKKILNSIYLEDLYDSWGDQYDYRPEKNLRYDIYHHNLTERLNAYEHFCERLLYYGINGSVFEVGTGFGYLLNTLFKNGFDVSGIELSKYTTQFSCEHFGFTSVRQGDFLEEDFNSHNFDLVILWHVFEHIPRLNLALRKCVDMLSRGGILMITVPFHDQFTKEKLNPVEHLYYFKKNHIEFFMKKHMNCETWVDGGYVFARKM